MGLIKRGNYVIPKRRLTTTISHLPFAVAAIDDSVVKIESTTPMPDFREGYDMWRSAFDQKKAGVWTAPVAEAIGAMEEALNDKN